MTKRIMIADIDVTKHYLCRTAIFGLGMNTLWPCIFVSTVEPGWKRGRVKLSKCQYGLTGHYIPLGSEFPREFRIYSDGKDQLYTEDFLINKDPNFVQDYISRLQGHIEKIQAPLHLLQSINIEDLK